MIKLVNLINELGINKPMQIIPTSIRNGWIKFNEHQVEYEYGSTTVSVDLLSAYSIWEEYGHNVGEDEDYYPVEESEQACNDYITQFEAYFGNGVFIGLDSYNCSMIIIPIDLFNRRLNNIKNSIIKYLGDGKFQYKNNILILRKLNSQEWRNEINNYVQYAHKAYPHMKYDEKPEEAIRYSELKHEQLYYILDKDGNILKTIFNPAVGVRNSIYSIPEGDNIEDHGLELIIYFNSYFQ